MKLPIFVLLPALVTIVGAWSIDSDGTIANFIWPKDSKDLRSFNSRESVQFYQPYFENFSRAIGDQLTNMKKLELYEGTVLQMYLKHNIQKLFISESKTKYLEIDPNKEYSITYLMVYGCDLTRIPPNINRLMRLTFLDLHYNKIEHVKMSDFNGLDNLEKLYLHQNGMKTLSSEATIHLPNLCDLWINHNDLQEINVCSWDMPTLEDLNIDNNKLKFVVNLVDQFPKLQTISAHNNPFVCSWKDDLVRSLNRKNIEQLYEDVACNTSDKTHVPTECPMVYSLTKQLMNLSESNSSGKIDQLMGKLNDEIHSLKQTITALIDQQRSFKQSTDMSMNRIESLEQTINKLNDENQSLKQTISTNTERLTKLRSFKRNSTEKNNQMMKELKDEIQSLKTQLTELHLSVDGVTEGFHRYVLLKEGGENERFFSKSQIRYRVE